MECRISEIIDFGIIPLCGCRSCYNLGEFGNQLCAFMGIDLSRGQAVVRKSKFMEEGRKRVVKQDSMLVCSYKLQEELRAEAAGLQAGARDSRRV